MTIKIICSNCGNEVKNWTNDAKKHDKTIKDEEIITVVWKCETCGASGMGIVPENIPDPKP